ncbi:MAG: hypothetical protein H8F28_12700 [Fibrella sp.]|nr:hypothetical protein [Armatimonadota bacterium]
MPFPEEYFAFVAMYRELEWQGGGFSIWGSGPSGNTPFLRDDLAQYPLLVAGDYFRFADGDQLILDHHTPEGSMYLYLHEDDSLSLFAPTFSLGLWRFAFESF